MGWDFRRNPPPVVPVDITTSGRADALLQAPDFRTFLDHIEAGGTFRWT